MSKKRILNVTSKKKSDLMAPNRGYPASPDASATSSVPITSGADYYASLWCATARPLREIFENDRGEVTAGRSSPVFVIFEVLRRRQVMPRMMVSRGDIARLFLPTRVIFHSVRSLRRSYDLVCYGFGRSRDLLQGCSPTSGGSRLPFNALLFKGNGITSEGVRVGGSYDSSCGPNKVQGY